MDLAAASYRLAAELSQDERFGLSSQIRRASTSIPANIAEGYGRDSKGSYSQFLKVAQGSLKELETHLLLAERLGLITPETTQPVLASCDALGRMLRSLIRAIERSDH